MSKREGWWTDNLMNDWVVKFRALNAGKHKVVMLVGKKTTLTVHTLWQAFKLAVAKCVSGGSYA